jgi:hypothetical protein
MWWLRIVAVERGGYDAGGGIEARADVDSVRVLAVRLDGEAGPGNRRAEPVERWTIRGGLPETL